MLRRTLTASFLASFCLATAISTATPAAAQTAATAYVVTSCGTLPSGVTYAARQTRPLTQDTNGKACSSASGGGGGSSVLTAIAALPTLSPGDQQPRGSLAGAAYVQPVYGSTAGGGTQVDATHGLPIHGDGTALPVSGTITAVTTITNPVGVKGVDGSTIAGSANAFPVAGTGTAGSAAGGVLTIQGVASMTKLLVTPDSVALPANQSVNVSQVNGTTILVNTGATGTGSPRVTAAQDTSTVAGAAPLTTGIYVTGPSAAALATATNVTETHGTIAAGTAATKAEAVGGIYNSSPITLTNGQGAAMQVDVNGNIKVASGYALSSPTSGQFLSPIGIASLSTTPTRTTAQTDMPAGTLNGAMAVQPYALPDSLVSGTTAAMTGTTSTSLIASPGGSLHNYITNIACVNSHATVGTLVTVQDGSGGTALYTLAAAAVFGGSSFTFPAPLRQPTAATALFVADVTTGANVICSASGFKAL